jgi:methyl-accepting chemotaxis protein
VEDATSAGTGVIEVRSGPYAEYEKRVAELEKQAASVTDGAIGAVKGQTAAVYERIKILGLGLFATVLLCQLFSAWAGRQLSKTLTSELNSLRDNAERISLGDLKNAVTVSTTDIEIVEVGEALDRLRVSLSKAMERLAAKRAPRPAES